MGHTFVQGLGGDFYSTSTAQRERMVGATQQLEKTNERLAFGKQQLAETEVSTVTCFSICLLLHDHSLPGPAMYCGCWGDTLAGGPGVGALMMCGGQ